MVNIAYSQPISASGGTGSYIFTVTAGALPPGLALTPLTSSPTALLSGTPTTTGHYTFTITATDENGCPGTQDYTMQANPAATIPTLSGWAMIVFTVLMALAGFAVIRRLT